MFSTEQMFPSRSMKYNSLNICSVLNIRSVNFTEQMFSKISSANFRLEHLVTHPLL